MTWRATGAVDDVAGYGWRVQVLNPNLKPLTLNPETWDDVAGYGWRVQVPSPRVPPGAAVTYDIELTRVSIPPS
jgi:hypothetical protein